ncbi:MAG TPA: cellulase family glycosylhydrolase [Streptosporangiaceae bacterium]|nr:cellulase family glycosylhydrolase [Streptosporangiaceae bacterium]
MKTRCCRSAVAVIGALLATASVSACRASHSSAQPPVPVGRCSAPDPANPVFSHTSGNRLLDTHGRVMVPYGITVFGLALRDWQAQEAQDRRQITAAITTWCTSYVRLMVAPANLLSATPYNASYLAAVRSEVRLALSYDNDVILCAQTERWSGHQPAGGPTQQTVRFWQVLAPAYDHNPRVWFDVFNEPRLHTSDVWGTWQDGGTVAGREYIGMQQLVTAVRAAAGDTNLIIVEGPLAAEALSGVPSHRITGTNLAYAVHPYGQTSHADWSSSFGQEAGTVPVLVDEWATSSRPKHGSCGPDPGAWVPAFFDYLHAKQIGLGVWGMVPGVLVTNTATFTPTRLAGNFTCLDRPESAIVSKNASSNGAHAVPQAQGVGRLVQRYFLRYARS